MMRVRIILPLPGPFAVTSGGRKKPGKPFPWGSVFILLLCIGILIKVVS